MLSRQHNIHSFNLLRSNKSSINYADDLNTSLPVKLDQRVKEKSQPGRIIKEILFSDFIRG